MNGRRHAQASTSSGVQLVLIQVATSEPSRMPKVRPEVSVPQAKPTRESGTCSETKTQAPGTSPPTAAPCSTRNNSSSSGAAMPMLAWVGSRPISRVGTAISSTLSMNMRLRPMRSPKWAMTMPPSGRAR